MSPHPGGHHPRRRGCPPAPQGGRGPRRRRAGHRLGRRGGRGAGRSAGPRPARRRRGAGPAPRRVRGRPGRPRRRPARGGGRERRLRPRGRGRRGHGRAGRALPAVRMGCAGGGAGSGGTRPPGRRRRHRPGAGRSRPDRRRSGPAARRPRVAVRRTGAPAGGGRVRHPIRDPVHDERSVGPVGRVLAGDPVVPVADPRPSDDSAPTARARRCSSTDRRRPLDPAVRAGLTDSAPFRPGSAGSDELAPQTAVGSARPPRRSPPSRLHRIRPLPAGSPPDWAGR
ncbi:MAG: hypothetical protein JWR81_274 [Pseudonocardia sp.]|nr:hypothetical protein [Pseudonocardia sp.]